MYTRLVRKLVFLLVIVVLVLSFAASVLADAGVPKKVDPKRTYGYVQYARAIEAMDQVHVPSVRRPVFSDLRTSEQVYWEIAKRAYGYEQFLRATDAMDSINLEFLDVSYGFRQYLKAMDAMEQVAD